MQGTRKRETVAPTHDFTLNPDVPQTTARTAVLRGLLGAWIEAAIEILDRLDGDPDLEDGGDVEPWLGAIETHLVALKSLPGATVEEAERIRDAGGLDQTTWGAGDRSDRELGDDNGLGDSGGVAEQLGAVWFGCAEDQLPPAPLNSSSAVLGLRR